MRFRRALTILITSVAVVLGILISTTPASATAKNGVVELGEFGLYLNTGSTGTVFDLYLDDDDFSNDVFPGTSISADNNTESYRNRDAYWWHVWTGANYTGSHGCLQSGYVGDASPTFKDTISSAMFSSSSC